MSTEGIEKSALLLLTISEDEAAEVLKHLSPRDVQKLGTAMAEMKTRPRDKIFKNMSQRAAEMLKEDLEAKGPVRLSEVEAEQKEILKIARRLSDEGQIVLGGGSGEDSFV